MSFLHAECNGDEDGVLTSTCKRRKLVNEVVLRASLSSQSGLIVS